MDIKKYLFALLCMTLSLPIVVAQEASEDDETVLEEITVTARKRQVDIQKAPVAVSSVDGDDLEHAGVAKLDDFNGYVPNLVIAKNDGAGRVVSIRGVGWETAQNLSSQPSVLVYLDGVYLANPLAMGLEFGEIERIEVLRGPQGTEFGQGTTGGAINIITKKGKVGETSGHVDVRGGSYDQFLGRASVNLSTSERFALHASVQNSSHDGFSEIRGGALDGYELDDLDATTGHLSLNWAPNDAVSVRIAGFWQDSDQGGAAQRHINDPSLDVRELTQDYPSTFALYNQSLSATIDWQTPWGFDVKWLSGYQKLEKEQTMDGDRLTSALTAVNLTGFYDSNFDILPFWDNNSNAVSHELNFQKSTDKLDWVVGAYYLDHENDTYFLEAIAPGEPEFYPQLDNPSPETLPPFTLPLEFVEDRTLTRKDSAIYAQFTYRTNEKMALTMGARYQEDESKDIATQFWFVNSEQVTKDDATTWKLGLDYNLSDDHLIYALVSTGWKNGGNNPGALNNNALDVPPNFAPEEVTAFEVGFKNLFFDNHLRFNSTFFYYDYENYQFIQEDPIPFAGGTGNIPDIKIMGWENEFSWRVNDGWRIDGHWNFNDGEIQSDIWALDPIDFRNSGVGRFLPDSVQGRADLRENLNGNTPPKLIESSGRLMFTYNHILDSGTLLTTRADFVYRGGFQARVFNDAEDDVPSYSTLGLTFEADFERIPLVASLSIINLADKAGVNGRFTNPFGLLTTSEEYIAPRQIVGRLRYRF